MEHLSDKALAEAVRTRRPALPGLPPLPAITEKTAASNRLWFRWTAGVLGAVPVVITGVWWVAQAVT